MTWHFINLLDQQRFELFLFGYQEQLIIFFLSFESVDQLFSIFFSPQVKIIVVIFLFIRVCSIPIIFVFFDLFWSTVAVVPMRPDTACYLLNMSWFLMIKEHAIRLGRRRLFILKDTCHRRLECFLQKKSRCSDGIFILKKFMGNAIFLAQ